MISLVGIVVLGVYRRSGPIAPLKNSRWRPDSVIAPCLRLALAREMDISWRLRQCLSTFEASCSGAGRDPPAMGTHPLCPLRREPVPGPAPGSIDCQAGDHRQYQTYANAYGHKSLLRSGSGNRVLARRGFCSSAWPEAKDTASTNFRREKCGMEGPGKLSKRAHHVVPYS
jgi:hypothetical protein